MEFFTIVGIIIIIYYLIYMVLLCSIDCDIGLAFSEYFGKSLEKLNGKVVWITGASSGIGEAMAYEVAKNNGKLILSARRESELQRVKARCLELNANLNPNNILVLPLDITNFDSHASSLTTAVEFFGQVDILINNAGRSQRAIWEDISLEVDRQMFDLNVFGTVALSRLAVRYFNGRGKGTIAVTSSVAGLIGAPYSGTYTASKHAIHGYFECLRNEKIGTKIYITLLCPGPVFSNFLQESFTAQPGEKYGQTVKDTDRRMDAERCAKLSLIAIVNKLDQAWMAVFPVIPLIYAVLYFPNLTRWLSKFIGRNNLQRLRDSRPTVKA